MNIDIEKLKEEARRKCIIPGSVIVRDQDNRLATVPDYTQWLLVFDGTIACSLPDDSMLHLRVGGQWAVVMSMPAPPEKSDQVKGIDNTIVSETYRDVASYAISQAIGCISPVNLKKKVVDDRVDVFIKTLIRDLELEAEMGEEEEDRDLASNVNIPKKRA